MKYQVYKIEWPDGSAYVGHTRQNLNNRLRHHRQGRLRNLMTQSHTVKVLRTFPTMREAVECERQEVLALAKPINMFTPVLSGIGERIDNSLGTAHRGDKPLPGTRHGNKGRVRPRIRDDATVRCSHCRETKTASEFHTDCSRHNGLHSRCKPCKTRLNTHKGISYRLNMDRIPNNVLCRCTKCKAIKPASEFHSDRSKKKGIVSACKDCIRTRNRNFWRKRRKRK